MRALVGAVWRQRRPRERGLARAASARRQRRRSGTTGRGPLSKSPDCPLLLDVRRPAGSPVGPGQARASGGHWLASGARPEILLAAASRRPEQRQLLQHLRRPRQHLRSRRHRAERRRHRARPAVAALDQRGAKRTRRSAWWPRRIGSGRQRGRGARSANGEADDVLDRHRVDVGELAPAAGACRRDALRHGARAESQQRRRTAVAARSGGTAPGRSDRERAARGRHEARLSKHRARATSGCRAARVSRASATNVPGIRRDPRHAAPGTARRRGDAR